MGNIKRSHPASFKAKVALELIKEKEPISAVCSRLRIHPTQAKRWRDRALEIISEGFEGKSAAVGQRQKEELTDELYKQIGQLKVELDWLKKNMGIIK